jgi:hypothetical protein
VTVTYEAWHWRIYSVVLRLFVLLLFLVGTGFLATGIGQATGWLRPQGSILAYLVLGSACLCVGLAMARRRSYRPDLGDVSWWAGKAGGYDPAAQRTGPARSWWTGDRKGE